MYQGVSAVEGAFPSLKRAFDRVFKMNQQHKSGILTGMHTGELNFGNELELAPDGRLFFSGDKDTSGVMILAKTRDAHRKLAEAFAGHELEKEYLAIIQGHIVNRKGRIEVAIERDKIHRKRMKATSAEKGRMAISIFEVLEYLKGATLVKVKILTGRTHQIRVHMAFTGHPLLGDVTYGGKRLEKKAEHFLHSHRLALKHPVTGKQLEFIAPMPDRFARILAQLRQEAPADSN